MTDFLSVYQEIRELGHDLVRLEFWAAEAARKQQWIRVGEINSEREDVRERRSQLMREVWEPRRRPTRSGDAVVGYRAV